MQKVLLTGSGKLTTQLGFGCGHLTPENAAVLHAAYDAGIRHFDVARAYGRGLTEAVVGKFLSAHPDCTVTTKFGINPPFSNQLHALARTLVRPVLKRLRRMPRVSGRIDQFPIAHNRKALFTPAEAVASMSLSLHNLRLQRVDVFLMHEPELEDLADLALEHALQAAVRGGSIGTFGVGGRRQHVGRLLAERPSYCNVLQYDWTALDPIPAHPGSLPIVYRTFGGSTAAVIEQVRSDASMCRSWSKDIGIDLAAPGQLERLLLRAALQLRSDAIVLFSSSQASRIADNVRAATDPRLAAPALRLAELARAWVASANRTAA